MQTMRVYLAYNLFLYNYELRMGSTLNIFKLWSNIYYIKFTILTIFKCTLQQFNTFILLCNQFSELLSSSKTESLDPLNNSFSSPPPAPDNHHFTLYSSEFTSLGTLLSIPHTVSVIFMIDLFHLVQCPQNLSMCLLKAEFLFFIKD